MRLFRVTLVLAIVLIACVSPSPLSDRVQAHELGLTHIIVTFLPDRTYKVEIPVDPESLLARLELMAGGKPSGIVPVNELQARIGALEQVLRDRARFLFDGQRQQPVFTYVPGPIALEAFSASAGITAASEAQSLAATASATAAADALSSRNAPRTSASGMGAIASGATSTPPAATSPGAAPSAGTPPSATTSSSSASAAPTALLRFTGDVPRGATRFQINYGLIIGAYALTVRSEQNPQPVTLWITAGEDSAAIDLTRGLVPPSRLTVATQYLVLGFEHILPKGLDHILFVLGIFLLSAAWRPVLLQVTTFTIAHSITLGLTIYGIVSLPSSIVEPLIALSITYVAVENLFTSTLKPWRLGLVFAFGLLHGMGFAGVLHDLGLPRSEFLTALVTFNLGVEAGQLTVIGMALLLVGWWRTSESGIYRRWIVIPASLLIAVVGAYWTIERTLGG
jgi:hydrogenase/urease accessory protein HupE